MASIWELTKKNRNKFLMHHQEQLLRNLKLAENYFKEENYKNVIDNFKDLINEKRKRNDLKELYLSRKACYLFYIALAYEGLKDFTKVIKYCKKVIKLNQKHIDAWVTMGWAHFDMKNYRKAIKCFEKTVTIDPHYLPAWRGLENAYNLIGDLEKSKSCMERYENNSKFYYDDITIFLSTTFNFIWRWF